MPAKSGRAQNGGSKGFTDEEKSAMRERAREVKAATEGAEGESLVLQKIAKMSEPDRSMAKRIHAVIKSAAPSLSPRLWYGMPAYALPGKEGRTICFFQDAAKFKTRYATLGFSDKAKLDEGEMWPVAYAVKRLSPKEEAEIASLVKRAVG
jgi:uncharacterized protein YdhG (YjbR/CyaY superfamily)